MVARLALVKGQIPAYRVAFSDLVAAEAGVAVELIGVANKLVSVRHIQVTIPSANILPLTIEKLSAASTGGTSTTPTPVPLRTSFVAASAVVRLYTAIPTKGTLIDQIQEIDLPTTSVLNEHYVLEDGTTSVVLEAAAQTLVLVVSATMTLNGYIEWTEEP